MHRIPETPGEVTAEWLTQVPDSAGVTDTPVSQVETTSFGDGVGMMSLMLRCGLSYGASGGGEPASLVVKLEPKSGSSRSYIDRWRGFEREIRFYREVARNAGLRVPAFYHGAYDDKGAVVVLDDLGHLRVADQIHGLRDQETIAAVRQIARLHARYWRSPALRGFDWMPVDETRLPINYRESWDRFEEIYGLRLGPEAVALVRRLRESLDWLRAEMAARPHTVCHGDLRADNVFFGAPGSADEVAIFDWQMCAQCFGALDVARLLGGSEPEAERHHHAGQVFEAWHQALLDEGVTDYGRDEALDDLRLGVLVNLCIPLRMMAVWGADAPGRKGKLLDVVTTRHFALALELDAARRLP